MRQVIESGADSRDGVFIGGRDPNDPNKPLSFLLRCLIDLRQQIIRNGVPLPNGIEAFAREFHQCVHCCDVKANGRMKNAVFVLFLQVGGFTIPIRLMLNTSPKASSPPSSSFRGSEAMATTEASSPIDTWRSIRKAALHSK